MNFTLSQYRWIKHNCKTEGRQLSDGKIYILFSPKTPQQQKQFATIFGDQTFMPLPQWQKLDRTLYTRLVRRDRLKYKAAVERLNSLSTAQLSALKTAQKINLLDGLIADVIGNDIETHAQNINAINIHKEKLSVLLFGLELPHKFLQEEQKKAHQFCRRMATIPALKENLENWPHLTARRRFQISHDILDVFNATYQTNITLKSFSISDWERQAVSRGLNPEEIMVPTGYAEENEIYLCREKLALCDNLAIPALVFHEALHVTQTQKDWSSYPTVQKLFEEKFNYLGVKNDDLYVMNPVEVHAYGIDRLVINYLQNDMQIKFIDSRYSAEEKRLIREAQTKSQTMMDYYLYRNNRHRG